MMLDDPIHADDTIEVRDIEGCLVATPALKDGLPEDDEYPAAEIRWGTTKEGRRFVIVAPEADHWIKAGRFIGEADARRVSEVLIREADLGGVSLAFLRPLLGRDRLRPYRQLLGTFVRMTAIDGIPPAAARFALEFIEGFGDAWRDVTRSNY